MSKKINACKTIIIAEIGECFNGDFDAANKLMSIARDAGCDIVKFQTLDFENISEEDPEKDWFKRIALTPEHIDLLIRDARKTGVHILFTPENEKTATWLLDAGRTDVKIASSSISERGYLNFINDHFERVFISTGMASLDEVKEAVNGLGKVKDLYILHCISEYPTGPLLDQRGLRALAPEDVRLNMMRMLMDLYPDHKIGYSDHTAGILAPVAAVAMGAMVIEKHITLDRQTAINNYRSGGEYLGTDHVLSIEPPELKEMVHQIREVEQMMGPWEWERTEGEKILRDFIRGRFT